MNSLLKGLPNEVNGNRINTDFRISMQFEQLLLDKHIDKIEKVIKALQLYYPDLNKITDLEKAFDDIVWFYQCGKMTKELANSKKQKNTEEKQIYNYEFDVFHIVSSFLEQYGIDLWNIEYMHWWKFRALFEDLSSGTKFGKILEYRAVDLAKIKDKELKKFYQSMKKTYGLPDLRTVEEKEADFASAFW